MLGSLRCLIDKNTSLVTEVEKRERETEGNTSFKMAMNQEHRAISVKRLANLSSFYFFHMI